MISVSVITTIDDLTVSREEWNALLARTEGRDNIFLHCEWFITWWRYFGQGRDLKIIVVREDGSMVAIFPFMVETERFLWKSIRKLKALENDHTYFYEVITPEKLLSREYIYEALFSYLRTEKWDLIELFNIFESSPTAESLRIIAKRNNMKIYLSQPKHKNPYILIDGAFEQYCQVLSKKFLKELSRRERKLNDIGAVSFEEIQKDDVSGSILEEGYDIEFQSWKGKDGTAILCNENVKSFYTEFAKVAALNGWLRLYFLKVGSTKIAFMYNIRYGGVEYCMKIGYKDDYSKYSPGNILQKYNLEAVFRDNLLQYEFLGNFTEQKKTWTSNGKMVFSVYLYNHSLFSRILFFYKFGLKCYLRRFALIVKIKNSMTSLINQNKKGHIKHGS